MRNRAEARAGPRRAYQCPDRVAHSRQAVLEWARGQHPRQPAVLEPDQQRLPARARPTDRGHTPAVGHVLHPRRAPARPGRRHRKARPRTRLRRYQWSRALAAEGATVVGLDLSEAQLAAAASAMGADRYPLVQGAAEQLPFAADSFDLVFCDFGGLSWAPPHLAVPQAARVLGQGGRLVFNVSRPMVRSLLRRSHAAV